MTTSERQRSPAELVRPDLRQLRAYHLDQTDFRFKLDQNEVPWDLPGRLKREALDRLESRNWAIYPDFHADGLRRRIARLAGWPFEGVLVGNGSNELLGLCLEAMAEPGGEVLGALPSFALYEMFVRRAGARSHFLEPRVDLRLQVDELLAEVKKEPARPLLLCSPNNPTGDAATPEQIEALLEELSGPLLLDNAYAEFCRHDYRSLLDRHRHLVLFRTLSKAWSLGGIRLGYLLADPDLVAELIKVKLPYNVGHASAAIGEVVLEHAEVSERAVRTLLGRRSQWLQMLRERGLEAFDSEANFILVRSPRSAEVRAGLAERGILVRDVSGYPGLEHCVRFAVGCGRALRCAAAALDEILGGTPEPQETA